MAAPLFSRNKACLLNTRWQQILLLNSCIETKWCTFAIPSAGKMVNVCHVEVIQEKVFFFHSHLSNFFCNKWIVKCYCFQTLHVNWDTCCYALTKLETLLSPSTTSQVCCTKIWPEYSRLFSDFTVTWTTGFSYGFRCEEMWPATSLVSIERFIDWFSATIGLWFSCGKLSGYKSGWLYQWEQKLRTPSTLGQNHNRGSSSTNSRKLSTVSTTSESCSCWRFSLFLPWTVQSEGWLMLNGLYWQSAVWRQHRLSDAWRGLRFRRSKSRKSSREECWLLLAFTLLHRCSI